MFQILFLAVFESLEFRLSIFVLFLIKIVFGIRIHSSCGICFLILLSCFAPYSPKTHNTHYFLKLFDCMVSYNCFLVLVKHFFVTPFLSISKIVYRTRNIF